MQCFKLTFFFCNGLQPQALIMLEYVIYIEIWEISDLRWFLKLPVMFVLS